MGIVASKWLAQRQPPTGPQGAPSGDSACASADMTIDQNVGTAVIPLAAILAVLGLPTTVNQIVGLQLQTIVDLDTGGETQFSPVLLTVSPTGVVSLNSPGGFNREYNAAGNVNIGTLSSFSDTGGSGAGLNALSISQDANGNYQLEVAYTPFGGSTVQSGAAKLCAELTTPGSGATGAG